MRNYSVLIHRDVFERVSNYLANLKNGSKAGARLQALLAKSDLARLGRDEFLEKLVQTKKPLIFAESGVEGNGSDWNLVGLSLFGYVSIAGSVTVYDDGVHKSPGVHAEPFSATLLFVPGALLNTGSESAPPADWDAVVANGHIDADAYYRLYEKRFLPVFSYADGVAASRGRKALITLPGLGCGMFAGPFQGELGIMLEKTLFRFLHQHGRSFANIKAVFYGPYNECDNARHEIQGISYMVRPFLFGNQTRPQLCHPSAYAEAGDDFTDCELFSLVAWDHVSWPGNDYYGGSRSTDDGVKAAATSSMQSMTGFSGRYDQSKFCYLPPEGYATWLDVVEKNDLQLQVIDRLQVFPK